MRRIATVLVVAGMLTAALAVPASADHRGEPHGRQPFAVTCDGQDYIVRAGAGNWSAAIADDGTVFLPVAFSFTVTMNGDVIESESLTKQGPKNATTVTCTFSEEFTDPETGDTFVFSGTAVVVVRPARG